MNGTERNGTHNGTERGKFVVMLGGLLKIKGERVSFGAAACLLEKIVIR